MNLVNNDDINILVDPFADAYQLGGRPAILSALTKIARNSLGPPPPPGYSTSTVARSDLQTLNTQEPIDGSAPLLTALAQVVEMLEHQASNYRVVQETLHKARRVYVQRFAPGEVTGVVSAIDLQAANDKTLLRELSLVDPNSVWADINVASFREIADAIASSSFDEYQRLADAVPRLAGTELGNTGMEALRSRFSRVKYSYFEKAPVACNQVARIYVDAKPSAWGTGWMLTPELMVTCWHVLAEGTTRSAIDVSQETLAHVADLLRFHFDPRPPDDGNECPDVCGAKLEAGCWAHGPNASPLDFAILRLPDQGANRSGLEVCRSALTVKREAFVAANIPQYPGGHPMMVGIRANRITRTDPTYITYETDTEGGSSGAPVCTDDWRVYGLHRRGEHLGNRATQVSAILDWLKKEQVALFKEIEAKGTLVD